MRISDWSSDVCSSDLFGVRDIAELMHASEHVIAAIMRALRVGDGIVARRRFRQSGDSGDFAERQLMDVLAEIYQRCRSDTVGAFPEKDLVEIQLKDFLLRQFIFDAQREQNFLEDRK